MFTDDIDEIERIAELNLYYDEHPELDPMTGEPRAQKRHGPRLAWPELRRVK